MHNQNSIEPCPALHSQRPSRQSRPRPRAAAILLPPGCIDARTGKSLSLLAPYSRAAKQRQARARREAQRRLKIVGQLLAQPMTLRAAHGQFGASPASLCRWLNRFKHFGPAGLMPGRAPGRPPADFGLSPATLREIARSACLLGSARQAWREFALRSECPPALRQRIGRWPLPPHLLRMTTPRRLPVQAAVTAYGDLVVLVPQTAATRCNALQRPKSSAT